MVEAPFVGALLVEATLAVVVVAGALVVVGALEVGALVVDDFEL